MFLYEPHHEKTCFLHIQKQSRRSAALLHMSSVVRKPAFYICKINAQISCTVTAQRLCFRYIKHTIPLLHKSRERGGSVVEYGLWSERMGVRNLPPPVVSLSKTIFSPKVLVIPRKWWLCPDTTEKLLTWTLNLNTNKHNFTNPKFQASSLCGCTARSQTLTQFFSCDAPDLCHR